MPDYWNRRCGCPALMNIRSQISDYKPCPICAAVEKLNSLAESKSYYPWITYDYHAGYRRACITCADILMEEFEDA